MRPNRTTHVFFAGQPTNRWRRKIFEFKSIPGWEIINGHTDLATAFQRSVFCLDLGGAGFSTRFTLAIILGCIPVYLDELDQPWNEQLSLDDFSIRFSHSDIDNLPEMLGNIAVWEIQAMQEMIHLEWTKFHWKHFFGSIGGDPNRMDAFDVLMQTLADMLPNEGITDEY